MPSRLLSGNRQRRKDDRRNDKRARPSHKHAPTAPALQTFDYRFPDMPQGRMTWRSTILGIDVEKLEGQLAEFFGVKEGVLVRMVNKDSSADKAGIRAGDVIVRLDDVKVATPADISAHLRFMHHWDERLIFLWLT